MKKTDNPVVIVNGNNNKVKINVTINETSSKISVAIVIAIAVTIIVSVLAVLRCCPDKLADFVRWIISTVTGS